MSDGIFSAIGDSDSSNFVVIHQSKLGNILALLVTRGAARNDVREGPVTDVVRFQTVGIFHKDHFDVTGQSLVNYNRT